MKMASERLSSTEREREREREGDVILEITRTRPTERRKLLSGLKVGKG